MPPDLLITRDEAEALLRPHMPTLADALLTGWSAWQRILMSDVGGPLSRSARARVVYDHATDRAEQLFASVPNVFTHRTYGLLIVDFGRVLIRFKKLDVDLRARGIPTGQQQMFAGQEHLLDAPQQLQLFPPAPMLIVGYVLDPLETTIDRMVVVLSIIDHVLWELPVVAPTLVVSGIGTDGEDAAAVVRSRRGQEAEREAQ